MRAIVAHRYGGPEVLELTTLPRPAPGPGEVLVRVVAAGTNPVDAHARSGAVPGWFGPGPHVWGWDVSGVVEAVGPGVTAFGPGEAVFGMPRFPGVAGGYAEYLSAPVGELAAVPDGVDHVGAAALPLAGLTALQTWERAGLAEGQRVLVHGAAGGVGHLAVRIAKARGARVVASARPKHHDFLHRLGADDVVSVPESGEPVDVVFDCVGDDRLLSVVRPGGVIAVVPGAARGAMALEATAGQVGVRVVRHVVHPDGRGLAQLAALVDAGRLAAEVSRALPLAEAAEAHRLLEAGHGRGKLVLVVDPEGVGR
ncbi:NADP-dependent oxidoreductase [Streptoalloteichus hindustanus]|uniref:NADPH:quinone reductase n=1 Tax=Streptoalloteichus hindustanus TaxID=2017 RepID=A0A1M4YDG9_STRHI|nr:NADP-dependent oxidoreductase [Streptoalloteichus hindustanus]SHF03506.1 NADPH:quinone reductase [Streptoalloteichus hindustanus]